MPKTLRSRKPVHEAACSQSAERTRFAESSVSRASERSCGSVAAERSSSLLSSKVRGRHGRYASRTCCRARAPQYRLLKIRQRGRPLTHSVPRARVQSLTASAMVRTPSRLSIRARCASTVRILIARLNAICFPGTPPPTPVSTSRSRWLSEPTRLAASSASALPSFQSFSSWSTL